MPDNPHKEIYGCDEALAFIKGNRSLSNSIDFLQQLANYGSNLIPSCYVSSERDILDTVVIASLLKHFVSMLDAAIVLLKQGAVLAANLPVRSMFESHVYSQWILKDDSDRRARQYFVWHWRKELDWTRVAIPGSKENERIKPVYKTEIGKIYFENLKQRQASAREKEKELLEILNSSEFKEVNDEYERLRVKKTGDRNNYDSNWYSLFGGPRNFRQLCVEQSIEGEYDIFYAHASEVMHATTQMEMITHRGSEILFEQIRSLDGFGDVARYSATLAIRTFHLMLQQYRTGEAMDNFPRKYRNEWREPYFKIPKVTSGKDNVKII
jgi:hypothetical protein